MKNKLEIDGSGDGINNVNGYHCLSVISYHAIVSNIEKLIETLKLSFSFSFSFSLSFLFFFFLCGNTSPKFYKWKKGCYLFYF